MESPQNLQPVVYASVATNLETTLDDDLGALLYDKQKDVERLKHQRLTQAAWGTVALIALLWSVVATALALRPRHHHRSVAEAPRLISRLAFGSCTARDLRPQPIWTQGVIPSQPDAWIWLGDFAYVDLPPWNADEMCDVYPDSDYCNCDREYLHPNKGSCLAGDLDHVRNRFQQQLQLPEYRAFLDYMCPDHQRTGAGAYPPAGGNPQICPRPILGVYDDHDYGLNNAGGRLPRKHQLKQLFLDALGEDPSSPRRSSMSGIQQHVQLNQGHEAREVDVILLDGRYYRDTLPCQMRAKWCKEVLETALKHHAKYVYCEDFLEGGNFGDGSCCRSDEELAGWCNQAHNAQHPLFHAACDPTSSEYGSQKLVLSADNSTLLMDSAQVWSQPGTTLHRRLAKDSPICDMLGMQQRQWLQDILRESHAPLKIVASGSVLMGALNFTNDEGLCSGDDWLCYPGAQVNMLHTLANTTHGCVMLLTGDFHFSDIKVAQAGQHAYSRVLRSEKLRKNVFQVMASGMSDTTAQHNGAPCEGTFREDLVGLRPLGKCSFMAKPSFGMLELDWKKQFVKLQIRDGIDGEVARGHDGSLQEVKISMKTCQVVD